MNDPFPSTIAERIDEICDRFEADWKAGRQPSINDYLDGTTGPERDGLLRELRRVDDHYRRCNRDGTTFARGNALPAPARPVVAGYEVLGELGRGGMGVVYQARQLRPNRLVALKMISAGAHAGVRELERFRCEAEAVAQLQHPHIVQVYEVGEQDGCPYFALEYVAGGSLDRFLAGTPQPPRAAAQLVERLAHAIHHAHQRGIIHRDLKPANILIAECGNPKAAPGEDAADDVTKTIGPSSALQTALSNPHSAIKITDFGLAKLLNADAGNRTQSGDLLGTPSYMAPEQVTGVTAITTATDVYGLGAILYELLTGRPPFRAETTLETMRQVETVEPVSPSRLQPKCPRDLVTICLKCLAKQPRQRYASAADLADELHRFLDGQPIHAKPVGPLAQVLKWTRRQPWIAGLAAMLLLSVTIGAGAGSWFWWQAEEGLRTADKALSNERAAQTERMATLDRYRVALAHREWLANNVGRANALLDACTEEQRQSWEWRYLDRMRRSALHTFAGHDNTVQAIAVHPSLPQVASASHDGTVRSWDLDTGRGTILGHHESAVLAVAYSPDGKLLASADSHHGKIKIRDTQSGAVREVQIDSERVASIWGLAFDRSSRYLAAAGRTRLKVWDTLEQKWAYDRAHGGEIFQVAFSPDGRYLATASWRVSVWAWTTDADKPRYEWSEHAVRTHDLAFNHDGTLLASGGRDGMVRVYNLRTGKGEFTLNAHELSVTSVAFSRDGKRLASAGQDGDMHVWDVKTRRRLFTLHGHSGAVWDLAYTADGTRLISAGSDFTIRVWDSAAGQEVETLPFRGVNEVTALAYGPGGRLVAWGDMNGWAGVWDTVRHKHVFRIREGNALSRSAIASFAFSPDGRFLACRRRLGTADLWDLDQGKEIPLHPAASEKVLGMTFSADGKHLLAASSDNDRLRLHELRTGQVLLDLARPGRIIAQVTWSPDARCFATLEDGQYARLWATDTGQFLGELAYQPTMNCIAFSDDCRFLAVGGVGGGLRVMDIQARQETMAVTGHSSRVFGLALSPDGRRLASAGSDCTVKLWDTRTGHEVLTLRTQLHEHSPLAFSPDGADLASVNMDNNLQTWSTRASRTNP